MADNFPLTPGTGRNAATDEVTYSGDTADVQLVRPVLTTGSEGSKTVVELTGDATNGLDVDVTRLPSLVAGTANIGDVDVLTVPAPLSTTGGGTEATALRVTIANDSTGLVSVDDNGGSLTVDGPLTDTELRAAAVPVSLASVPSHAVTNAGTFATQVDGAALTALQLIDDAVFSDEAAFTPATSKVVASGLHCVVHGSAPDAAVVDTVVNPVANRDRVPFVIGGHPNPFTYSMSITTAVTNAIIGATNASGTKPVVTGITAVLDNASTVYPTFIIGFGTASTPAMATTPGTAQILASHPGIPEGGGMSRGDGSGILGVGGDGDEIRITTTGTAGGNGLYVTVTGYLVPS